jgi:hypothetical protein
MGKLYSYTYMSLDGVVESPEKWTSPYFSDQMASDLTTRLEAAAGMVLGHVTYNEFAAFWPNQDDSVPFATLNNSIRKYVISSTLSDPDWQNSRVVPPNEVANLKFSAEGDLHITGSGTGTQLAYAGPTGRGADPDVSCCSRPR